MNKMKKIILNILLIILVLFVVGCDEPTPPDDPDGPGTTENPGEDEGVKLLSFSQAQSIEELQKLNGKEVMIIGYMSTLSPISGEFMYLMNLPYQSCPFCIPNSTQLANTMAVYAKSSKGFEFTDRAIEVTGILEFGDFTDEFGYIYNYRITDATYKVVNTEDMDPKLKLWQQLASTDVISEVFQMYEYLNFLCYWPSYTIEFETGRDYVYPGDALYFIQTDKAQFNYGYKENYFKNIISTIKSVNETEFNTLVNNITKAEELSKLALSQLVDGKYTVVPEYSKVFNDGRTQYQIIIYEQLEKGIDELYTEFSHWLSSWEL